MLSGGIYARVHFNGQYSSIPSQLPEVLSGSDPEKLTKLPRQLSTVHPLPHSRFQGIFIDSKARSWSKSLARSSHDGGFRWWLFLPNHTQAN